jgi:transketolase
VEDHQIMGGLGGAVAEVLAAHHPVPMEFVGVHDQFGESGTAKELLEHFGLTVEDIIAAVRTAVSRKK